MLTPAERRIFAEELAYLIAERSGYRTVADDEAEPYGVQYKARLRAEGCNRAIRSLRNVLDGLAGVERREAADALAAGVAG